MNRRLLAAATVAAMLVVGLCSTAFGASSSALPKHQQVPPPKTSHALSGAITFDEVATGTTIAEQYLDRGVYFGDPNNPVFTLNDGSNPTSPSLSGTPKFHGSIHFSFVHPGTKDPREVRGFDLDVGHIDNRNSVQIRYYDRNGSILGAVRAQSLGMNHISVRQNNIVTVEVEETSREDAGFGIDNLAFETDATGATVQRMAMMGDSFASGEGLTAGQGDVYDCGTDLQKQTYYEGTTVKRWHMWRKGADCMIGASGQPAPRQDLLQRFPLAEYENKCHRAGVAWPNQVRVSLGVSADNALFVACSGATTLNLGARNPGSAVNALPGSVVQYSKSPPGVHGGDFQANNMRDFVSKKGPLDLITISVGGNDAGFGAIIGRCQVSDCLSERGSVISWFAGYKTVDEAMAALQEEIYYKLRTSFTGIRAEFSSATIAVFGYPNAMDPDACNDSWVGAGIDNREQVFLTRVYLPAINTTIREAAEASGVTFIDLSGVARGHELCKGSESWFSGLLGGDDALGGTIGNESYHPNQNYHRAVQKHFMDNYVANGRLVFSNPEPRVPIRDEALANRIVFGHVDANARVSCGVECILVRTCTPGECGVQITGSQLTPNTNIRFRGVQMGGALPPAGGAGVQNAHGAKVLHQEAAPTEPTPFELGAVTTDAQGAFSVDLPVPSGLSPGTYMVLVDGTDPVQPTQIGTAFFQVDDPGGARAGLAAGVVKAKVLRWGRDGLRVRLTCLKGLSVLPCTTSLSLHRTAKAKARLATAPKTTVKIGRSKVVTLRARSLTSVNKRISTARAKLRTAKRLKARTPVARRAKVRAVKKATARTVRAIKARQRVIKTNRTVVAKLKVRRGVVRVLDAEVRSTLVAKPVKVKKTRAKVGKGKAGAPKVSKKR